MLKAVARAVGCLVILGLFGCASSGGGSAPAVKTTKQFKLETIALHFEQSRTPDIVYHTPEELDALLKSRVVALLGEKKLLSDQAGMNKLNISANYKRRFMGDQSPFPSDALAYPNYSYKIDVADDAKTLVTLEKSDLTFAGGLVMNAKLLAGALRDKRYEEDFVEALASSIVEQIEKL